ncbi:NB-ARC domain-containing protein [Trichocoleus desertorum AS-A10]|uniref:NB-ARC domain-containing protein n=1 Tax=Trichocoleus desertorum TaxID=1481672 RepID=UPI0032983E7C
MPSLKVSPQELNRIKQLRKARHWAIEDRQWLIVASQILDSATDWGSEAYAGQQIFAPGVSLSTWKRFLRGEAINAKVFKAFCQVLELPWQSVVELEETVGISSPLVPPAVSLSCYQDWGEAPEVPVFFGRSQELSTLEQWVLGDRCRLVAILGIGGTGKTGLSLKFGSGGMGKTNLSLALAQNIQDEFECIVWRSLLNASSLATLLVDLIQILSNQQESTLPNTLEDSLSRLLHYLRSRRCLLILDNVETILQGGDVAGQYRAGYEGYGQLFKQLGEVPHKSCLLLTSREKPREVARLEGRNRPVRSLELGGLGVTDGQQIFTEIDEFSGSEQDWQELIALYNGNPLALELAAKHIRDVFGGNLNEFLKYGKPIFHDLQDLLDWYFQRLTEQEIEVIYWLVINREPVAIAQLSEDLLSPISKEQLPTTLQSLQRRLALEKTGDRFTLHPVLMEYFVAQFIQAIAAEIQTGDIRFFKSHTLLKAIAKDYIREAQKQLILQPLTDQLLAKLGEFAAVEQQLNQLLAELRGKPSSYTGYAAGNILNLLCHLKVDLSDRDFSNLAIRQAYLANISLHRINLTDTTIERSVFTETTGSILAITFSPDGNLLATGETDGILRLWHVHSGRQILTWKGHSSWVSSVVFSPDGSILASSNLDHTIRFWDIATKTYLRTLEGHTGWVQDILFSVDGQLLFSASSDQTVKIWQVSTGICLKTLAGHCDRIWKLALSPDGRLLASGSSDFTIRLWDTHTGECMRVLKGHQHWIRFVEFYPDNKTLLSIGDDKTLRRWDCHTGECLAILPNHMQLLISSTSNETGKLLAMADPENRVQLWSLENWCCEKILEGHSNQISAIAFSSDGMTCATGGEDQILKIWDVQTGQLVRALHGFKDEVTAIVHSHTNNWLVSGYRNGTIRLWNSSTGEGCKTFEEHTARIWSVTLSSDNSMIASAGGDSSIRVWDAETGACLRVLPGSNYWFWAVAFSLNNEVLISGAGNGCIQFWDVRLGECLRAIAAHQGRAWSLSCSPDGKTLVSGGQDLAVKFWDLSSGKYLGELPPVEHPVWLGEFSPDGQILACSSPDGTLSLWDANTRNCLHFLPGHSKQTWRAKFSVDSKLLASCSDDQTARIWDVAAGKCLQVLTGHTHTVNSVYFLPDNQTLATGSQDGTIRLWEVITGKCLNVLRAPRPYEGMKIKGIKGLTDAEKETLHLLGAVS